MLRIDDKDLVRAIAGLRTADKELHKALRKGMREAGNDVRDAVRRAAAGTGSTRIPRSIKTQVRTTKQKVRVTVRADPKVAPHAKVMEGGRGGRPARHPVFTHLVKKGAKWTWGGQAWVAQPPRPYFYDTARARQDEAQRTIFALAESAVKQALRSRR